MEEFSNEVLTSSFEEASRKLRMDSWSLQDVGTDLLVQILARGGHPNHPLAVEALRFRGEWEELERAVGNSMVLLNYLRGPDALDLTENMRSWSLWSQPGVFERVTGLALDVMGGPLPPGVIVAAFLAAEAAGEPASAAARFLESGLSRAGEYDMGCVIFASKGQVLKLEGGVGFVSQVGGAEQLRGWPDYMHGNQAAWDALRKADPLVLWESELIWVDRAAAKAGLLVDVTSRPPGAKVPSYPRAVYVTRLSSQVVVNGHVWAVAEQELHALRNAPAGVEVDRTRSVRMNLWGEDALGALDQYLGVGFNVVVREIHGVSCTDVAKRLAGSVRFQKGDARACGDSGCGLTSVTVANRAPVHPMGSPQWFVDLEALSASGVGPPASTAALAPAPVSAEHAAAAAAFLGRQDLSQVAFTARMVDNLVACDEKLLTKVPFKYIQGRDRMSRTLGRALQVHNVSSEDAWAWIVDALQSETHMSAEDIVATASCM